MRFRVWSRVYKRYFTDDFLTDCDGNLFENQRGELEITSSNDWIVEYSTGLFDLNGTEIYEGDIMQFHKGHAYPYKAVKFDQLYDDNADGSFLTWTADSYSVLGNTCFPVIGNIHENPELLLMRRAKNE